MTRSVSTSSAMTTLSSSVVFLASSLFLDYVLSRSFFVSKKNRDDKNDSNHESASSSVVGGALHLMKHRRSIFPRQYTKGGPSVPKEVLNDMLEAARWAPTHHLTQPWHFVIFETEKRRRELGFFLADMYKTHTTNEAFSPKKYDKKINSALASTYIIAICVRRADSSNEEISSSKTVPEVEDICSVAMAVQNMHLVASERGVGCYWSSASIYDKDRKKERAIVNPDALKVFLDLPSPQDSFCIGWLFVGPYDAKKPTKGKRDSIDTKVVWR